MKKNKTLKKCLITTIATTAIIRNHIKITPFNYLSLFFAKVRILRKIYKSIEKNNFTVIIVS